MMPETAATTRRQITRISNTGITKDDDSLVVEEPLEIRVRGKGIAVTMRTPGYDFELAAGVRGGHLERQTGVQGACVP